MGTGSAGQYAGKIRFIEKPGVQNYWGRHVAKRRSEPRVAYPDVKVQVQDLVRVVCIVVPFAFEESVFGKNSFNRAQGGKWAEEISAGCPQQRL